MTKEDSIIINIFIIFVTLFLIVYQLVRVLGTECFSWFDYGISFSVLFINILLATINVKEAK